MLEIIILLAVSWLLVWLFEKGNLSVLGLNPTKKRLSYAFILFIVAGICCSTGYLMRMYFAQQTFPLNQKISAGLVFTGLWLNLKSVLFEELLCRGAGLYILVKKTGKRTGILISAIVFGVLHWMNTGVFGDVTQMAIVFSFTFFMGLLLAYAFVQSGSLYLPIAIHLGWNLVQNFLFPDGPFGISVLVNPAAQPEVTVSYFIYFAILLLPKISSIVVNYFIVRRYSEKP